MKRWSRCSTPCSGASASASELFHVKQGREWDVVVVGGGHAGCEAAAAAARRGARTLLITHDRRTIGAMSCNPAFGGIGKGHIVREVDAFDGLIARAADFAAIHYRMLNASKGKAVQGPRVQADRGRYARAIRSLLVGQAGLAIIEAGVDDLVIENGCIVGVVTDAGDRMSARAVVIASGTFLGGRLFRGEESEDGGRRAERAATALGRTLRGLGLPLARLKTGTPPRLDGRTIDWACLPPQPSDDGDWTMSPLSRRRYAPPLACAETRTNPHTHDIIRGALNRSPLHSGAIEGRGPRYCPSIEDKIARFGDRNGHGIFLEPEGLNTPLVYPNGISTSLPIDAQEEMIRSIKGLRRAEIVHPGYAVEYDYVDPRSLDATLGVPTLPGLFLAGQINGTTGYEEAAGQGLVAGLNAAAHAQEEEPVIFDRADSYIGVMIDDLTLQGVQEPYRMLTARAEHRLRLRADNAQTRLASAARAAACLSPNRLAHLERHERDVAQAYAELAKIANAEQIGGTGHPRPLRDWLLQHGTVNRVRPLTRTAPGPVLDEAIEDAIYAPYVERQSREIAETRRA